MTLWQRPRSVDARRTGRPTSSSAQKTSAAPAAWRVPSGWTLHYTPVTVSTNDDAQAAIHHGAPSRSIFLADDQIAGRGRQGRKWVSAPGGSLLLSIVVEHPLAPLDLTVVCSISVVDAILELTPLDPQVKWPNDIMIGGRKVGGILTEVVTNKGRRSTIVGIGLNVDFGAGIDVPPNATSLASEVGGPVSRGAVFESLMCHVDDRLCEEPTELLPRIRRRWESLLWRRRQRVTVAQGEAQIVGTVEGVSSAGALLLRDEDGRLLEVAVGDVFAAT